jgi:hypothetical protein
VTRVLNGCLPAIALHLCLPRLNLARTTRPADSPLDSFRIGGCC